MVLLCATCFNTIPDAVDVICVRHSKNVIFIGANIMEMFVSVFVIYIKFYCY